MLCQAKWIGILSAVLLYSGCQAAPVSEQATLEGPPPVGHHELRILSPTVLELFLVTTKEPNPARVTEWDFVHGDYELRLPKTNEFKVLVNGKEISPSKLGFRRRTVYAPLKRRDLRLGNHLFLILAEPLPESADVQVLNPSGTLWGEDKEFSAAYDPMRWSPAIHVNQVGYEPGFPKQAMGGYYLGSLGELEIQADKFAIVKAGSGEVVFEGPLRPRRDIGFTFETYQKVLEADFSALKEPGEYRLQIPGLGVSYPFRIQTGTAAAFARAYALGLYHQRCGMANELPYTRFLHEPCHIKPAEVPTDQFKAVQAFLADMTSDVANQPAAKAPRLENLAASLYPFVERGTIDVSGGHHDAGDYSKYTINSAGLIHHLIFAVDSIPGVAQLDNLGVPESGDGKSDLLQEAKWEADFLAKMQDKDGGFYFLVYPKERKYEDDVLPDEGDPQVVYPKNTTATAAAVAALAQTSGSPLFKKLFPKEAALYQAKAIKGWKFLQKALQEHGPDGAYQKLTHYGNEFGHDDELVWAAVELFLATGNPEYQESFLGKFDPSDRETRRWTWWRMYESYGAAIRSYAFGARSGRLKKEQLDPQFLRKCEAEVAAAAADQVRFARESAYGTSFPDPSKRFRTAGWYFSLDRAFDIVAAAGLEGSIPKEGPADPLAAIVSNLNYEAGGNPVNVSYITGLGWKRPRDIVHQYAQNDRRHLPPSGLPIGNLQGGFQFLHHYEKELGEVTYPPDGAEELPYPIYDRWGDSFNVGTEFVVVNQARGLACAAFLMAKTALKDQQWRAAAAEIRIAKDDSGKGTRASLHAEGLDLKDAVIVWEAAEQEPVLGKGIEWNGARNNGWMEAEAQLPDGRRVFGIKE